MVAQSPTGELEILLGKSTYSYHGNWKLQNESGLDGYHVSTVHYNYVATVQHRHQVNGEQGQVGDTLDYSKLGGSTCLKARASTAYFTQSAPSDPQWPGIEAYPAAPVPAPRRNGSCLAPQ
ncbi:Anthranilate 1,2-dioxygenase large subunit [compost metagenome]